MKTKKSKATLLYIVVALFLLIAFLWRKIFPKRSFEDSTTMTDDIINTVTIYNPFMSARKTASAIIKKYEGLRLKAYLDTGNVPTIGYGNTKYMNGTPVKMGDVITKEQAEKEFEYDLSEFFNDVKSRLKVSVTDAQLAALVSFAYNVGIGAMLKSTLWRLLHEGQPKVTVANELRKWVYDNGKKITGLVNRRESERNLYLT